jgi:hypothetical protein
MSISEHVHQMIRLADTLRRQRLIAQYEQPVASMIEIDVDEEDVERGPGRCAWVFTNEALHIIDLPVGEQRTARLRLGLAESAWTVQLKANPAAGDMVMAIIRRGPAVVHIGILPTNNDLFVSRLWMLRSQRPYVPGRPTHDVEDRIMDQPGSA